MQSSMQCGRIAAKKIYTKVQTCDTNGDHGMWTCDTNGKNYRKLKLWEGKGREDCMLTKTIKKNCCVILENCIVFSKCGDNDFLFIS